MSTMEIIIRARDLASDVMRRVSVNSRAMMGEFKKMSRELRAFQDQMKGSTSFQLKLSTRSFSDGLKRAVRAAVQARERIQAEFELIRQAAQNGADFKVNLDGAGGVAAGFALIEGLVDKLDGRDATIQAALDGFAKTAAQLKALDRLATRINTRRYRMTFDSSAAILATKLLGDTLGLLREFETTFAVLHAIQVPAFIGAIGGAATGALGLAGAAGSAAIAVGQGLAGAFGVGATAAGLGAGALLGYREALKTTLKYSFDLTDAIYAQRSNYENSNKILNDAKRFLKETTAGTEEHRLALNGVALAQLNANFEKEKYNALLRAATPEMLSLIGTANQLTLAYIDLGAAVATRVAPFMERWLQQTMVLMAQMRPGILGFVDDMNRAADAVVRTATSGQQLASFTAILQGVAAAGVPALRLVSNALFSVVNFMALGVPYGLNLLNVMAQLSARAREWTASADGQARMAEVWASLAQSGAWLLAVVGNLAVGLWGVISALSQSGTVDMMASAILGLSLQFRELMSAGGQGRAAIVGFMQDIQPSLAAAGSLLKAIVIEFFRVAGAIASVKAQDSELPMLAQFLYTIQGAIRPIGDLIIKNFVLMAPLIGPLIVNVAKLAGVFLQAMPPLVAFLEVGNRFLGWFTSLNAQTQITLAKIVSWGIALKLLSGPIASVGASLGGFVNAIRIAGAAAVAGSGATGSLGRGFAAVRGGVMGALRALPLIGPVLGALMSPIGLVVVAVAGLVAGVVALYRNWDRVVAFLEGRGVQGLGAFGAQLSAAGQAIWTGLVSYAQMAVAWFQTHWPSIRQQAVSLGNAFMAVMWPMVRAVLNQMIQWGSQVVVWFQENWPLIRATAQMVANGVAEWFRFLSFVVRSVFGALVEFWRENNVALRNIAEGIWRIIVALIEGAVRTIGNVVKLAMQLLTGDWRGAWNTILDILRTWRDTGQEILRGALQAIWGIFQLGLNRVDRLVASIFEGIAAEIERRMNRARDLIRSAIDFIQGAWEKLGDRLPGNVRDTFERVANGMVDMLEGGVNRARDWLAEILYAVRNVADALGMDSVASSAGGAARDLDAPIRMATGGVINQDATGGLADGSTPRAVYGEARSAEAYIVKDRPTTEQLPYLRTAAKWHGYELAPRRLLGPRPTEFGGDGSEINRVALWRQGGVEMYAEGGFSQADLDRAKSFARSQAGKPYQWGGGGNPSYDCSGFTAAVHDVLMGGDGKGRLYSTHAFTSDNPGFGYKRGTGQYTVGVTHAGVGHMAGTVDGLNVESRGGDGVVVGPNARGAMDSMFTAGQWYLGKAGAISSGGGGFDWLPVLLGGIKKIKEIISGGFGDGFGLPGEAVIGWAQGIPGHVLNWLKEKATELFGSLFGGGGGGGNYGEGALSESEARDAATKGLRLGAAFPASDANVAAIMRRAYQESNWNPRAINRWDVNWLNGDPSKGFMQIIGSTWELVRSMFGSDIGPFSSGWADPIKSVAAGTRWMKHNYGHIRDADGQGYAFGGVIAGGVPGAPAMAKVHYGERVLPAGMARAFEKDARERVRAAREHRRAERGSLTENHTVNGGVSVTFNVYESKDPKETARENAREFQKVLAGLQKKARGRRARIARGEE